MKELDITNYPLFLEVLSNASHHPREPRSYPGYPQVDLPAVGKKLFNKSLAQALRQRRRNSPLPTELPAAKLLGQVLQQAHGVTSEAGKGPTPSAGNLQALELYLVSFGEGWLPTGGYHYDRSQHLLTRHFEGATRESVEQSWVPSMATVGGGRLLWVLVGDVARVERKYSFRALQFLCLEAGHLMQNLCLLIPTVPLGGFFECDLASAFQLPAGDRVLYVGLC